MLVIGLMSGTSMDGIDAVLAEFREDWTGFKGLRATHHAAIHPVPAARACSRWPRSDAALSLRELATLDVAVAERFAEAALGLLAAAGVEAAEVGAIGSHGQTVFHDTVSRPWATQQLGDPSRIAARSGIATVADFRRKDVALGGQGAPLVPAFHHALFASADEARCALNIGGIANVTLLPGADAAQVRGFDTGPGNGLMDEWSERELGRSAMTPAAPSPPAAAATEACCGPCWPIRISPSRRRKAPAAAISSWPG